MIQTRNLSCNVAASTQINSIVFPSDAMLYGISWSGWWLSSTDSDTFIAQLYSSSVAAVDQSTNDLANLIGEVRGAMKVGAAFAQSLQSIFYFQPLLGLYIARNTRLTLALQSGTASVTVRAILTYQANN